ncbi:MAG TPA: hypothetical protein PLV92_00890, partial [Pirellulaceae bacterium]|nr:hypothetical protein [Pirellulaceae bacterium]
MLRSKAPPANETPEQKKARLSGEQATVRNTLAGKVLEHPLVRGLADAEAGLERQVSYISSSTFATALLDVIAPAGKDPRGLADVRRAIADNLPADCKVKQTLLALADQAGYRVDKFQDAIAHWFDETQSHVTAIYRKKSGMWVAVVAAVVVTILNVDSLRIGARLWNDSQLRTAVADAARDYVAEQKAAQNEGAKSGREVDPPAPGDKSAAVKKDSLQLFREARSQFDSLDLPIGWSGELIPGFWGAESEPANAAGGTKSGTTGAAKSGVKASAVNARQSLLGYIFAKIAGLLVTVVAISLGAPFWFDMLNKIVNLRAAVGAKPATLKEQQAGEASGK